MRTDLREIEWEVVQGIRLVQDSVQRCFFKRGHVILIT
jgi:hypothetical protein